MEMRREMRGGRMGKGRRSVLNGVREYEVGRLDFMLYYQLEVTAHK